MNWIQTCIARIEFTGTCRLLAFLLFGIVITCDPFLVHSGITVFKAGRALTVGEIGALSDLDNITVRIADVAANLAILGDRFRDEFGSSALP